MADSEIDDAAPARKVWVTCPECHGNGNCPVCGGAGEILVYRAAHIAALSELDGLSVKDTAHMPHPADLAQWSAAGLYRIDAQLGIFRLTEKGRRLCNA